MRAIAKASILATALFALALAGCVDDDTDAGDDKATTTPAAKDTKSVHGKAKHKKYMHADPVAHAKKLADHLGLNKDQQAKVEGIFKSDANWHAKKKQIDALLTPEQRVKLAELKKKHHHGKKHHADPKAHAQKLADLVKLSKDQQAKVEAIFRSKADWHTKKKQVHALLTPAQRKQLAEFKHKHHGKMDPDVIAKKKAAWLQEKLGLTDKQKADIVNAWKSGKTWHDKKQAIKKLLSKDQAEELDRLLGEMKLKHHHKRMHN